MIAERIQIKRVLVKYHHLKFARVPALLRQSLNGLTYFYFTSALSSKGVSSSMHSEEVTKPGVTVGSRALTFWERFPKGASLTAEERSPIFKSFSAPCKHCHKAPNCTGFFFLSFLSFSLINFALAKNKTQDMERMKMLIIVYEMVSASISIQSCCTR